MPVTSLVHGHSICSIVKYLPCSGLACSGQQHNIDESAKMEEFQKQQQHNIDESAKMEEFQKQQQHNIDESAKMEEFQKQQQHNIDESAKMEEFQKAPIVSAPIDQVGLILKGAETEAGTKESPPGKKGLGGKGKIEHLVAILTPAVQWRRYDLFRIVGAIVLLIFIIYTVHRLNAQNEKMNEMQLEMAESLKSVQGMVVAELENGNFSMPAQEEEEQTKLGELKHLREMIKQFELELKETKGIDPFQIVGAIVLFIFVIYTIHRLNKQNASFVAELREQKQSNANKFAENEQKNALQQEKVVKLEKYQNEQQPNIVDLQKTVAVLCKIGLINRWDSEDCHDDLWLTEHRLVAQHFGENSVWHSVRAEKPMAENPFFEVQIFVKKGRISIGLAIERIPLNKSVGNHRRTYAYESDGTLWGHEVAGCDHNGDGRPYIDGKLEFEKGDVIGCGVNLETDQIIYMLNGERLDTDGLLVEFADSLFACVSLDMPGTQIQANFGPNFQFPLQDCR